MPDILARLDAAIGRLAETQPTSRSSRARWDEAGATGAAKSLNINTVPVLPVVPVAKRAPYPITAQSRISLFANESDAPLKVSSLLTGSTGSTGSIEDFRGFQSSRNLMADGNDGNSEPAAASDEPARDGIPRAWADGVAKLTTIARPAMVRPDRWRRAVADAECFLDQWGAQAASLGWSTLDVFGAHPTHPVQRLDLAGLLLLLHGDELAAITADTAGIRTRSGAILTYYRRPRPGAVPLWRLAAPVDAAVAQPIEALSDIVREAKRLFPGATVTVREATFAGSASDKPRLQSQTPSSVTSTQDCDGVY